MVHTKAIKRLSVVLVAAGLLFWLTAGLLLHVSAAEKGSFSMICRSVDGVLLPGMHWRLYHAANKEQEGFVLTGGFEKYSIKIDNSTASALADTAQTLETYANINKNIKPVMETSAGEDGIVTFDNLSEGLYLICGDPYKLGTTTYFPSPFLMEVGKNGGQVFDMMAMPKSVVQDADEGGFGYSVKKVWANDEAEPWNRSAYVTVDIYCDSELWKTVTLSEENDWTYAWQADAPHRWEVVEPYVPQKYSVTYRTNETQFVIVNSLTDSSSINESVITTATDYSHTTTATTDDNFSVIDGSDQNVGGTTNEAFETGKVTTDQSEENQTTVKNTTKNKITTTTKTRTTTVNTKGGGTGKGEKLPQTGQLWWPVPTLAVAGVILMAVGLRLRPKE